MGLSPVPFSRIGIYFKESKCTLNVSAPCSPVVYNGYINKNIFQINFCKVCITVFNHCNFFWEDLVFL